MKKRLLMFVLSVFMLIPAYAQYITGKVVSDDDNEPLVGATVWFLENPKAKVRVNDDGTYRIRFRQGRLNFHCFGFQDKVVSVKSAKSVNVRLSASSSQIAEVTVKAEKKKYVRKGNPAVEIMQKVMAAKKTTDIYQNDFVSFNKYERMMLAINNITEEVLNDEHMKKANVMKEFVERNPYTGQLILPISVDEKKTRELYRKSDVRKFSVIEGENHESLLDVMQIGTNFETLFKDCITDINLFENDIHLFQHNFISPIGDKAAISFYHYALEDSLDVDGDYCYKISFTPANPIDFGFSGNLYINADSTWRLKRAKIGVPVKTGVNFVKQMDVDMEYSTLPTGEQICQKNHMIFQLYVTSWIKQMHFDYNVTYSDWNFDPINKKEFSKMADQRYELGAKHRDSTFWAEVRPDTISYAQSHVGDMKKKFTERPVIRAVLYGAKIILDNWLATNTDPTKKSKVMIGPFFSMFGTSWLEGFRIRVGAKTTAAFNKNWFLEGWTKYGFKDNKFKGHAGVTYSFIEKEGDVIDFPMQSLTVSYTRDVQSPSDKFLEFNKDNAFMSLAWSRNRLQTYFENFNATLIWEWENGLRIHTEFNREWNDATGYDLNNGMERQDRYADMMFIPVNKNLDPIKRITTTDLKLSIDFQPGVKYINTGTKRFLVNQEAPVYGFTHTTGIKGFLGGDYNYNFTEFTFQKRFWLPQAWGCVDLRAQAGIQWNQVPYPLLIVPSSNLSYIRSENTFSLLKNMEFLNDRYASLMFQWDLNGKIFNRIPLLKFLKWRGHCGANLLWGYLSDKNNPYLEQNQNSDILMYFPNVYIGDEKNYTSGIMDTKKPYVEAYFGIHNILKFFSVDYFHRFTYIDANTQKWGLRFSFKASF